MESIFLILSGVILAAGVLYWFWSHIQLTQKKVQLLENAVFELRGMLTQRPPEPVVVTAPPPVYADLPDDDDDNGWTQSQSPSPSQSQSPEHLSTPLTSLQKEDTIDLQPGGRIDLPAEEKSSEKNVEFRELFTAPVESTQQSLDSMPVKELRRLAEQRGIANVNDMRKKELISALRQQIVPDKSAEPQVEPQVEPQAEVTLTLDENTVSLA